MSKHKKRKHKRVADPYDDYMQKRHAYWAACAKKGELTEKQVHTCDELEMFVSAVIVFSDISPKDTELFERAWSFRDVFLRFACQPEDDLEPSFYFHEEEHTLYVLAGPRNGSSGALTEGMFSAALFTEERIFFFDSMVEDELQKQLSPEAASSGFYPMVMQAPLQNVESVTFRPACPLFPNGSVVVRFRVSDVFLTKASAFAEIMDKRDPKIAEKIRNDFSPIWESELGMPCAHARQDYRALMPTLEHLAELGDFRIEDHLLKDT